MAKNELSRRMQPVSFSAECALPSSVVLRGPLHVRVWRETAYNSHVDRNLRVNRLIILRGIGKAFMRPPRYEGPYGG